MMEMIKWITFGHKLNVYFIVNLIISFLFASNKDTSTDTDDFWIYFFMYFVGLTIVYYVLKWVIKGFIKK